MLREQRQEAEQSLKPMKYPRVAKKTPRIPIDGEDVLVDLSNNVPNRRVILHGLSRQGRNVNNGDFDDSWLCGC